MKSKVCGYEGNEQMVEVKNGYICRERFNRMPKSVQMNIKRFTVRQLWRLDELIYEPTKETLGSNGHFSISKHAICVDGREFRLRDLRYISFSFNPRELGKEPNTLTGLYSVRISTKRPHFIIEELYFPGNITVEYKITENGIHYYNKEMDTLTRILNECIWKKSYDTTEYMKEYREVLQKQKTEAEAERKKAQEETRKKAEAEAARKRAQEEARKRAETEAAKKKAQEEARKKAEAEAARKRAQEEARKKAEEEAKRKAEEEARRRAMDRRRKTITLEEARSMFGMGAHYTMAELKKSRNRLLKKYHPDAGGTEEMSKKINEAYAALSSFAAAS